MSQRGSLKFMLGVQERRGVTEDFYSGFNEETVESYRVLSAV